MSTVFLPSALTLEQSMLRAIQEGQKGFGNVSPNPLVGCVVLNAQHELLSTGYHKKYGGPHAEVEALKNLSQRELSGAHVIVTLEPCAHQGKTPACADMIAGLPIATLTYGIQDPNPLVCGKGIKKIQEAGILVKHLTTMQDECAELCEVFLHNINEKKPFVALKMGSSLDGIIALRTGESKWLTSELSREKVHYLRAGYDAICVGANTVIVDNPRLNIRHEQFKDKPNKVVILDHSGELIHKINKYEVSKTHQLSDIIIVVGKGKRIASEVHIIESACFDDGTFDLDELLKRLYQEGIRSLFVEGGAKTYSQFIQQKAFQRLYLFQAPVILGSKNGRSWSEGFQISKLEDKLKLKNIKVQKLGDDFMFTAKI